MLTNRVRKWIVVLVGVLALALLTGAGTALAVQSHYEPATSSKASTLAGHAVNQTGDAQQFIGFVQSIDQAKQMFWFQPSSQAKAIAIAFDARTAIPKNHWTMQGSRGQQFVVQVMMRLDGSWYATRITQVQVQVKSVPASVQNGSYPTWREGPCGWGWRGGYHH